MGAGGEQQRVVGVGHQARHPLDGQAAVGEGERLVVAAHGHPVWIVTVGRVDGGDGPVVTRVQTAHSESPTAATNGPVSS